MTVRANFSKSWLRRYLWVAAICFAGVAWCLYDGLVAYPRQLEIARAYEALQRDDPAGLTLEKRWRALTEAKGWSDETPRKVEEIEHSIGQQWMMAAIACVIGLPVLVLYFRSRGAWIESTARGLRSSWGQEVDFEQVTRLDKSRWKKKGIAKAEYTEGGQRRTFVFDDFKYEREPIGQLLARLEQGLAPEQIAGESGQPSVQA